MKEKRMELQREDIFWKRRKRKGKGRKVGKRRKEKRKQEKGEGSEQKKRCKGGSKTSKGWKEKEREERKGKEEYRPEEGMEQDARE